MERNPMFVVQERYITGLYPHGLEELASSRQQLRRF